MNASIRILNGNNDRLRALLGPLAQHVQVQKGDAVLTVEKDQDVAVGRDVFELMLTQGYTAFAVKTDDHGRGTGESTRIEKGQWDPALHDLTVIVGPNAGG